MSALFKPLQINSLVFANRVFVAPMCQYSASDGVVGDWHWQHLGALAVGGAGALTIEAAAVTPEGRITKGCLGLYDDDQEVALTVLLGYLRRLSPIRIGIQLNHAGRKGSCHKPWNGGAGLGQDEGAWSLLAPSPLAFGRNRTTPAELDEFGMKRIEEAFANAARRALRAGVDYLELHLAHGYLLNSFLSPISNQRADGFGGALKSRMRFPLAVVSRVREVWPEDKPLGVRINSSDWTDGGLQFEDTLAICEALKERGVDFVCISAGAIAEGIKIPAAPGYLAKYAAEVKAATGLITRVVGCLDDCELSERVISSAQADCVAIGRAMLFDPRWALKAAHRLGADVGFPNQYMLCSPQRWQGATFSVLK
jgi:NADPH2 dehydrogenase